MEGKQKAQQEAEVADPVDDKSFCGCLRRGWPVVVVADKQIGCKAYTFPSDEKQKKVIGQDK